MRAKGQGGTLPVAAAPWLGACPLQLGLEVHGGWRALVGRSRARGLVGWKEEGEVLGW